MPARIEKSEAAIDPLRKARSSTSNSRAPAFRFGDLEISAW
jgi:hypothetical protein